MSVISVVMPVYNAEKYLKQSIESILNQTYKDFEFIIINDGSTDSSLNIINTYAKKDNRIIVVSRENKGLVYSLNEGIKLARGKYIARMDADDISMPERFETQYNYMITHKYIDVLGCRVNTFGDESEKLKLEIYNRYGKCIPNKDLAEQYFLKQNLICHPSVIMKKSYLHKMNGYSNKYNCAEDYDLWMRSVKSGFYIKNLNKILISYRVHKKSKVRIENKNFGTIKDLINIKLDYIQERFQNNRIKYLIWGAGNGGIITKKIIENRIKNSQFIKFIDKSKIGDYICKANDIEKFDFNYIFIATAPGRDEAEEFLVSRGYKPIEDFLWTI